MLIRLVALGLLLISSAAAAPAPCGAGTKTGVPCSCDVRTLRPLQGALGLEEVQEKAEKITAKPKKEWQDLEADPIKIVRGPGGAFFITDHHHGADAWRLAGRPVALCQIGDRPPFETETQFWSGLVADNLVRLADANGKAISPTQLPASLDQMPDDRFRSLAWRVRKADGFCRSEMQKEFAEFKWADWMRTQPALANTANASAASLLPTALTLVRSPAAREIPGYVGDKAAGFKCPKDP